MGYVDQTLLPGERVTYRTRLHGILFAPTFILAILTLMLLLTWLRAGTLLLLVTIGTGFLAYLRLKASEFAVTNKRIIVKVGFIRRRTIEILLSRVEALEVVQGVWGRILGFGTIVIVGTGGTKEPFPDIAAPLEFRRAAQAASCGLDLSEASTQSLAAPVTPRSPEPIRDRIIGGVILGIFVLASIYLIRCSGPGP